jgi:site-specific recombinase XerD
MITSVPLAPLLEQWLTALPVRYRQSGAIRGYRHAVEAFLTWYEHAAQQPLTLVHFTPALLLDYRTYLHEEQGVAERSLTRTMEALRSWYAWLAKTYAPERLHSDRSAGEWTPWGREALTPTQVFALLEQAQATRDGARNVAIVQLLVHTGMRVEECCRLTWADVVPGFPQGSLILRQENGTQSRRLPLPAPAQQSLLTYLATQMGCSPTLSAVTEHWPLPGSPACATSLWRSQKGGALTSTAMGHMLLLVLRMTSARDHFPSRTNVATLRRTFARTYLTEHPGDYERLACLLDEPVSVIRGAYCAPDAGARNRTRKGTLNAGARWNDHVKSSG